MYVCVSTWVSCMCLVCVCVYWCLWKRLDLTLRVVGMVGCKQCQLLDRRCPGNSTEEEK